jgi:hypothetical protein
VVRQKWAKLCNKSEAIGDSTNIIITIMTIIMIIIISSSSSNGLLLTAIELSPDGSSPYISRDKITKNKCI